MVIKFIKGPVVFKQKVKVNDINTPIKGEIEFTSCDDEKCLTPQLVNYVFNLNGEAVASNTAGALLPGDGSSINQTRETIRSTYEAPVGDCGVEDVARDTNLLWTFVLGFLGGLVALLTPCVFPMIPLTVSFFTKSSEEKGSGIRNALIYGLSIIVIYVSIGLIITGVFGATALNLLSTNWIANTLFFLIFVFFAFSFFGYYEITLPSSWANKSNTMADKGGLLGIFFMAFTLALVSFSCTGPIIGSALVQSATSSLGPFVVMLGFSSALAIPFTLFAAFPSWLNSLPRSGSWMNSVKVVLGFLELALALKFLSVADMTMHWNILPYEVFMGLWVIIFAAMTAYLFGLFKFPHDSPMKKLSPTRGFFAVGSLALTVYLISGFFLNDVTKSYNSLKLMSGLAPPSQYNVLLPEAEVDATIKAKYPSFTKCANNLDCFKDYYEGMAYAKENNKPVLLDFTGYGCVNCRKTEEHIWIADKVRDNIQENYVLISLYVDDRKELENILFSEPRQTKLRRVGDMWADFQIVNFEQNSQPLYVMMSPDEKVLAAPRGYKEGVEDYADFLDCGLNTFKNNK
jgi:thiol:disulfide interchange protein DsbD